MKKKEITLKNIIILGKFSDEKVRQIICDEEQQVFALAAVMRHSKNGVNRVIDDPIENISWDSNTDLTEIIKKLNKI